MYWDEYSRWLRKWSRFPFFSGWYFRDVHQMMRDMEKIMEEMFKEFGERVPQSLIRERKLPDGSVVREMGPFIYGYSLAIGPDKKPIIREFGNLKPSLRIRPWEPPFDLKEEREPLVDVIEGNAEIKVIAELPGVEKSDIKLLATENTLTISVDTAKRKYQKELKLPAEIDPEKTKSTYKNGVLEVRLARIVKKRKPKGIAIKIE